METSDAAPDLKCQWCGVIHLTTKCPQVKAIDYWPDGKIKRVEFHADKPIVGCTPNLSATT